MKTFLTAMIMVLVFGAIASAQFNMYYSLPILPVDPSFPPIRPAITNEFSHLGAAYTIGMEAGNLTGNYGNYFQVRLSPKTNPSDIGLEMMVYDRSGSLLEDRSKLLGGGTSSTIGLGTFGMIIGSDQLFYESYLPRNERSMEDVEDIDVFGMLGGYIDYVIISGSGVVEVKDFQFGNGWVEDRDNYGYTNMQFIYSHKDGINNSTNGNISCNTTMAYTSKALAWNAKTGAAMRGQFTTGGPLGLMAWNHLTFTFGSFERVSAPPVPEPGTLLMLGLAAVGLPAVRRLRKG